MNIKSAKYKKSKITNENGSIELTFNDDTTCQVPLSVGNRHYAEILKQVEEGILTIEDAD